MATRLQFDFTAQEGTHFGKMTSPEPVKPPEQIVAEMTDRIDIWNPDPASITVAVGKVTAWTGLSGRQLLNATATKQPVWDVDALRFYDPATGTPNAFLSLSGTQLGAQNKLTIATKIRLSDAALLTDLHYIFGWAVPINRMMYRYANGNKYLRLQCGTTNVDCALPLSHGADLGVVVVYDFAAGGVGNVTLHVSGVGSGSAAMTAVPEFTGFTVGGVGGAGTVEDLPGWVSRVGIWAKTPTAAELTALLAWIG